MFVPQQQLHSLTQTLLRPVELATHPTVVQVPDKCYCYTTMSTMQQLQQ